MMSRTHTSSCCWALVADLVDMGLALGVIEAWGSSDGDWIVGRWMCVRALTGMRGWRQAREVGAVCGGGNRRQCAVVGIEGVHRGVAGGRRQRWGAGGDGVAASTSGGGFTGHRWGVG